MPQKMNDSKQITVNAELVLRMLDGPKRAGIAIEKLLSSCNLNPDELQRPDYRIPVISAVELLQRVGYLMDDEFLGFISSPLPHGYFRQSILSIIHQPTVGAALAQLMDFNNVFINDLRFEIRKKRKIVNISIQRTSSDFVVDNVTIDCIMAIWHRLAGWLCNEVLILNHVQLDYSPPPYHKEYRYLFYGAPISFNSTINCISFDAHYLDLPVVQTEASAKVYIRRAPLDIFLPQDIQGEMSRSIHETLRISFTQSRQPAELQEIAEEMDLSTQTLRRRLTKEGTSFNAIKSQVRRDIAMHALGHPELSIEEVAIQTGYSEPAAFIRAFKSWTGFTPAKFRLGVF